LKSDRGNAVVEFVAVGLVLQLLIFGFLVNLGQAYRSQLAAESLARQALRQYQLTGSESSAIGIATQVITTFGLNDDDVSYDVNPDCRKTGKVQVTSTVRDKSFSVIGFCLD
jgi:Flp pilus assembly protein TadG